MSIKNAKDYTGKTIGRLTCLYRNGNIGNNAAWVCRCECGNEKLVSAKRLSTETTRSCGCLAKESARNLLTKMNHKHGMAHEKVYKIWSSMLQRCNNENDKYFYNYGGRGIKVCERWSNFENFFKDMGSPKKRMTLDRINNDENYSPENCQWVDRFVQMRNTRRTVIIEFDGKKQCLKDWAKDIGINPMTLYRRIQKWPLEKALTTKSMNRKCI